MEGRTWRLKVVWFAVIAVALLAYGCGKGEGPEMPADLKAPGEGPAKAML